MIDDKYYRYDGYEYITLDVYKVVKETKQGCLVVPEWVKPGDWDIKDAILVRNWANKRFAYPTPIEALESFKRRKLAEMKLLKRRLGRAEVALNEAYKLDSSVPKVYPKYEEEYE